MQLINPGSHNLPFLFFSIIVLTVGIVGLLIFFQSLRRLKKTGWSFLAITLISFSGLLISFSLFNFINYQIIYNQYKNENIGKYINSESGYFIELNEDMTWNTSPELFICEKGEWEYIIDEDSEWINLLGGCEVYFHYQFSPTRYNKTIEIFPENGVIPNRVKLFLKKE